ncbi:MAG: N-formylglutamate amidohydrolase [Sphingomonadales bacterium]|nr:N-formylglutamate amidohydrolase [Sphingomonadales bacterium]
MNGRPFRILGEPRFGGILVVSDHAGNDVPPDIDLGIDPALLDAHVGIDIGVAAVAEAMASRPGIAAFLGTVSRLVCDCNREEDCPELVPLTSDGHAIPGNMIDAQGRAARLARVHRPYHAALAGLLDAVPPALIVSLHSFTPALADPAAPPRPWHVGVLYNADDRAARLALPMLAAEGLHVGDQQPYSGRTLNATMDRHAEAEGRPYLGIEIRQDEIGHAAGQAIWGARLARIANAIALRLG